MFKIITRILFVIIVVVALLFLCAYIIFNTRGKQILEARLKDVITAQVSVGKISLQFPLSIKIKNLEIEDFLKTDLKLNINPLSIFSGRIILNNIILDEPKLTLTKERGGYFNVPFKQEALTAKAGPSLIPLALDIRDGYIFFIDKSSEDSYLNIYDIDVKVRKRGVDLRPVFNFIVSADIAVESYDEDNFQTSGWVDLAKKDMDGNLEVRDLNTKYLVPFFKGIFRNKLSQAMMNFKADMKAKDNNLKIDCHLEVAGLKPQVEDEQQLKSEEHKDVSVFADLLDIFSSPKGKLVLNFVIHTKLDNPKFDRINFGTSLFEAAAKNILSRPAEEIVSTVESIGKDIEAIGKDKIEEIIEEGLGGIIDIFKDK